MKYVVWLVTVGGLLPIGLLSIACLGYRVFLANAERQDSEPNAVSITTGSTLQIGVSGIKIQLSRSVWPAVATLLGIALVLIGMFFLLQNAPKRFYRGGLLKIGDYVERMLHSQGDYASVIITSEDHAHSVLIARRGDRVLLSVVSREDSTQVLKARMEALCAKRGIVPCPELLDSHEKNGETPSHSQFVLGQNWEANTELIRSLFKDVFGADELASLEFTTTGF